MGKAHAGPGESETQRRTYELLDSAAALAPGTAQRLCSAVRDMRRADADGMKQARQLLRSAMSGIDDYGAVYRAWIATMEADIGSGIGIGIGIGVGAARELVMDWGCVCAAEGTADDYAAFWIGYLAFELRHGGGAGVRAVVADAARACPGDAAVRAMCAVAERRLAAGTPGKTRCRWWTRLARAPSAAVMAVAACHCSPAAAWVR